MTDPWEQWQPESRPDSSPLSRFSTDRDFLTVASARRIGAGRTMEPKHNSQTPKKSLPGTNASTLRRRVWGRISQQQA